MRIIRTQNKRGAFWTVDGQVSLQLVDDAVEVAIQTLAEVMSQKPIRTLWTEYT